MVGTVDIERLESLGLVRKPKVEDQSLGQDEFLELMTTQLQNQDPFKPMENGEFLGQIAQFASVRGIQSLQDSFSEISGALVSNQALQASSLVGRSVVVPGNHGVFTGEQPMIGGVELPNGADELVVRVFDQGGQLVKQMSLGAHNNGRVEFGWDGQSDGGDQVSPGVYRFEASARIAGQEVGAETMATVPVESVSLGKAGEGISVNLLGLGPRDFSEVREIR